MGKFTAIVLFIAGFIVLGSAARAAGDNRFLVSTPEVVEHIDMEPDTLIVARPNPGSIEVDLVLLKSDLGLAKKSPVRAAKKAPTCSRRELVQSARVGEMVTTCDY